MHDSEQEHSGITGCRVTYESTIFYNEANKFSIIVVKTSDPRIPPQACSGRYYGDRMLRFTAVGYELPRTKAVELELDGEWVESKYGYQLQVEQWQEIVPQTADGLLAYLGSGLIKGIGPKTAEDIVATFGPDTLNILDNEPEKLLQIRGITEGKLKDIEESYAESRVLRNLMSLLGPFKITPATALKIYQNFGPACVDILKKCPYDLCQISGFGFKRVDGIVRSLNAGVLYTERVRYLVTSAVKLIGGHRVLAVYFYECERLKANDRMPKWVVFQGKDTFATLERDAEGNGVHVALPRSLTKGSNGREKKHHLDVAGACVTSHGNKCAGHGGKGITADVQLIHTVHLGNKSRGKDQCDNQRDVDGPREHAEQIFVTENMSGVIGAHTDHSAVNLLQNVGDTNHQVIFVGHQQLGSLDETVFLIFLDFGFISSIYKFFFRQFLDGENRKRIDNQTDDGVDDSHRAPCLGSVPQSRNRQQCDGLNGKAGGKRKHEAIGTHLNTLGAILGDERGQSGVGNIVGGVEHSVQQSIADEKPCVLSKLAHIHGNGEDANQRDGTADISVEHPRTCLAQL